MTADVEHTGDRGPAAIVPTTREDRIVAVCERVSTLTDHDLAIVAWAVDHLPVAALQAKCHEIKERGRVPALSPNTYEPTPAEYVALAALLVAVHDVSVAIGGPGLRGGWIGGAK